MSSADADVRALHENDANPDPVQTTGVDVKHGKEKEKENPGVCSQCVPEFGEFKTKTENNIKHMTTEIHMLRNSVHTDFWTLKRKLEPLEQQMSQVVQSMDEDYERFRAFKREVRDALTLLSTTLFTLMACNGAFLVYYLTR